MTPRDAASGLSRLQRDILVMLFNDYTTTINRRRDTFLHGRTEHWGVRLRPVRGQETRATQAARSRAVARLEARGLVLRQNEARGCPTTGCARTSVSDPKAARTTSVLLLPAGIELAQRLTARTVLGVNRSGWGSVCGGVR